MGSSEFCVKWNDHSNLLSSVCRNLLDDNFLVDCTIAAEGQFFKAHRLILSACSPYFKQLFKQDIEKHPIIFLRDTKSNELKALIDFIYYGEAQVPEDCLAAFLRLAQSLQIKGLKESTQGNVNKQSVKTSSRNCNATVPECIPMNSTVLTVEPDVSHLVNGKNKPFIENVESNYCTDDIVQCQPSYPSDVCPGLVNSTVEPEASHSIYLKNNHVIGNVQPNNSSENTRQYESSYPSDVCPGLVNPGLLPIPVEVFNDNHYEQNPPKTPQDPCSSGVELPLQTGTVIKNEVDEIEIVEPQFEEINVDMDFETSDNCFAREMHREDSKCLEESVVSQSQAANDVQKMKSHRLVIGLGGKPGKRAPRNRCRLCYAMISKQIGSILAANRTPKVSTYCGGCDGKPFLCERCFDEYHRILDIKLHRFQRP